MKSHNVQSNRASTILSNHATNAQRLIFLQMADYLIPVVLDALSATDESILTANIFPSIPFNAIKSALDRLGSRELITYKQLDREEAILTEEGHEVAASGSHEAKVFEAVRKAVEGMKIGDLPVCQSVWEQNGTWLMSTPGCRG